MARPQVFISSTYYDLRHIRASLEGFVDRLGYDPILSEKGKIAYDPDAPLDESCYREAAGANIFVLIIGGRYGSAASGESLDGKPDFYKRYESITRKEYQSALRHDIPTYILIERSVFAEYETFRKNRDNEHIEYAHVESINVFRLIDDIWAKGRNNPVHPFERHTDIESWLREQWAGLFRDLLSRRTQQQQLMTLSDRMDELSSINSSLQRYLEEVVANVAPDRSAEIIREEKERYKNDKIRREMMQVHLVRFLVEEQEITTLDELGSMFATVRTYNEVADWFESIEYDSYDENMKFLCEEESLMRKDVDEIRRMLGAGPLSLALKSNARPVRSFNNLNGN